MRTIHRSRTVALGVGIALLLGALPCSADPAPNLAMLPIRMLDTSGEPKDQTSEHAARLAAMAQGLSARLSAKGCFRVVGIDAEALARSCPGNEPACILGVARANGAGLAFVGVIHKSSTLIMQMFARIVETGGGATTFSRELNFRGDNDESLAARGSLPCARDRGRPARRGKRKDVREEMIDAAGTARNARIDAAPHLGLGPPTMWTRLAHPGHFLRWTGPVMPWLAGLSAVLLAIGLYLTWFVVPPDYQQGETVRIMYIHVPAAWLGVFFYGSMAISAIGTLVWRHPLADVAQRAAAPIGAAFTLICLVTGSLWGKPMWGTYWVWDARLTSMLILFLIYCGIIALWRTIEDPNRAARAIAILTLVGAVNLPIIKFSVNWWSTLHQPASIMRMGGSSIDPSMLYPLLEMILAFTLLGITLHLYAMRTEILRRRVRALTIREAERLDADPRTARPLGQAIRGV